MEEIKSLKYGCSKAFEHIYEIYAGRLYYFINSIVRSRVDSEDILQSVFTKLWEVKGEIDEERNFEAYLYTIARNLCISHLRRRLYTHIYKEEDNFQHNDVVNGILANDCARFLRAAINTLPERRREIFLLSRLSNLTYKQIAEKLGISENTVDTQIRRALDFLKEQLAKEQLLTLFLLLLL